MSRIAMFVYDDVVHDARVLREAAALAASGHGVTVFGRPPELTAATGDRVAGEGFEIVRVPVPGTWRHVWALIRYPWRLRAAWAQGMRASVRRGLPGTVGAVALLVTALVVLPWLVIRLAAHWLMGRRPGGARDADTLDWLVVWRFAILGWAGRAARIAETEGPFDILVGHDLSGLAAAVRTPARPGRTLVYDSHELFLESGATARRPRWARAILSRLERRWAAGAAALVTVNGTLELELRSRLGLSRSIVVHNCPPRWTPPESRPDLLREAAGIPRTAPVVLYHGGFSVDRGLLQLAEAILQPAVARAHLVYLGFGALGDSLATLGAEPRYAGRLHVLAGVPPDELPSWVASADVGLMPNQPVNANERLSTPNKLFESIAAGLPVVTSDFPERRRIVLGDPDGPLGAVCDPTSPASIAAAIASIIDLPPAEREALRARCLAAAHARWNWETESSRLVALYAELSR